MPAFRVNRTTPGNGGKGSKFFVTWIRGELKPGDTFRVRDADHWWQATVQQVLVSGVEGVLVCDLDLGWDGQYSPALVDTDEPTFQYVAT